MPRRMQILSNSVQWHVDELTSRIIAESGIPTDKYHLGKIILRSFKDDPDLIHQIDGGTGQSETNESLWKRSVRCAISLRKLGFQRGDVMVLMAPNHLDLAVPFYAALYLGIMIAPVDKNLGVNELKYTFNIIKPKIIFCQSDKVSDIQVVLKKLDIQAKIVTFDKGRFEYCFSDLMDDSCHEQAVMDFKPADFDPEDTISFLITTSGTTGPPKAAAVTHKNFAVTGPHLWLWLVEFPKTIRMLLLVAPLQWLTALIVYTSGPYLKYPRLQSSLPITKDHAYHLINTYKPSLFIASPTMMTSLVKSADRDKCDFTCFEHILLGGSALYIELITELKKLTPETVVVNVFAMSETTNIAFSNYFSTPPTSCGKPIGNFQYRLVNIDTGEDVGDEPNVPGELWLKGPGVFKEYYNNPTATAESFAEGNWFKTGDMFCRDENWNYYFVERIKLLLKYKSYQISPVEVESVIRQHSGVLDVVVTGIPDPECGELPVACVVPRPGHTVTAQEIKDLVKDSLIDAKQLRGGVIFMKELPMTVTTKVHRRKLKELALEMERE